MKVLSPQEPQNIEMAVAVLRQGGLVAFPTETVYGLGADATNEKAVCRIFEAKKRPTFDPLIVHVDSPKAASALWLETPKVAADLMKEFWPGPLTLVLPRAAGVLDVVTSGLPTVAVRMPKNHHALSLITALGRPIAAPSANLFGYTSPTSAAHVFEDLGEKVDLVLDGGDTVCGLESTVIKIEHDEGDADRFHAVLLRPGAVTQEQIEKFLPFKKPSKAPAVLEAPGQMESHYAPWTQFFLLNQPWIDCRREMQGILRGLQEKKQSSLRVGLLSFGPVEDPSFLESVQVLSPKKDLLEAAANLFQAIRKLDKMHLDLLLAEPVPEKGIGLAIMDRLKKASGGRVLC